MERSVRPSCAGGTRAEGPRGGGAPPTRSDLAALGAVLPRGGRCSAALPRRPARGAGAAPLRRLPACGATPVRPASLAPALPAAPCGASASGAALPERDGGGERHCATATVPPPGAGGRHPGCAERLLRSVPRR